MLLSQENDCCILRDDSQQIGSTWAEQIHLKDIKSNFSLYQPCLWVSIFYFILFVYLLYTLIIHIFSDLDYNLKMKLLLFLILLQLSFCIFYYTSYCCTWWETWEVHWDELQEVATKKCCSTLQLWILLRSYMRMPLC